MQQIWSPWRIDYVRSPKPDGCVFCDAPEQDGGEESLILFRGEHSYVMMNRYPYTNGHLLVAPWNHTPTLDGLSEEELLDLMVHVRRAVAVLRTAVSPDGFNIGVNLGSAAGAGVKAHVHVHVVPRWTGDTNFMTVLAEVRVISEHLLQTYRRLFPLFSEGEF